MDVESVPSYIESGKTDARECYRPDPRNVRRVIDFDGISEDETMRVYLRVKPILNGSVNEINSKHYNLTDNSFITILSDGKSEVSNEYFFNKVLWPNTTQQEVFDLIVRPRLQEVLEGMDALLFSYGTTSSGKSYTIQGKGSEPGIIPRVLYVIFASIGDCLDKRNNLYPFESANVCELQAKNIQKLKKEKLQLLDRSESILLQLKNKNADGNDTIRATTCEQMEDYLVEVEPLNIEKEDCIYSVWISFIEIYNEIVYDLFVKPESTIALKLARDNTMSSYVKGVKYMCVSSWSEAYQLYLYGKHNLHVSPTSQNVKSSRSHCILTIKIIKQFNEDGERYYSTSSFSICDLAGAERQKETKLCANARMKESKNINTSLLVLNRCFNIIRSNQSKDEQDQHLVPFRESKLTLLFQHALLGNAAITMLTNISQSDQLLSETQQVLKSTAVAKRIKAKAFFKKPLNKRKSIFDDYYLTRSDNGGAGSALRCTNCVVSKKINEDLQQTLAQKNATIQQLTDEVDAKCDEREKQIRKELVQKFMQMANETSEEHRGKMEKLREEHRQEMHDLRRSYRNYYEKKFKTKISTESQESQPQAQNQHDVSIKLSKLYDLLGIGSYSEENLPNLEQILDKIIDTIEKRSSERMDEHQEMMERASSRTLELQEILSKEQLKLKELENTNKDLEGKINELKLNNVIKSVDEEEMGRIQGILSNLQKKMFVVCEELSIEINSDGDNEANGALDKILQSYRKILDRNLELEKILSKGATEFNELRMNSGKLEEKINQLEEEIIIKNLKIEELRNDVDSLSSMLAMKTERENLQIESETVAALERLTLGPPNKILEKSSRRNIRQQNLLDTVPLDNSDSDPSFMPVFAATTSKKKKKKTKRFLDEIPSGSYDLPSVSLLGDASLNTTTRTRRKLFLKDCNQIDDDQTIVIAGQDESQPSPQSFMRNLRSRNK